MKKHIKKLCATALSLAVFLSAIPPLTTNAKKVQEDITFSTETPFVMTEDENGIHYYGSTGNSEEESSKSVEVIESPEEYYELTDKGVQIVGGLPLLKSSNTLPTSVDNSQSKHFPEIGNQGGLGSCCSFASVYYQFTYEMNKARGIETTPENTSSPAFVYNLINGGSNNGTTYEHNYRVLAERGAAPLSIVPYDDSDYLDYHAYENIWREAIRYRLKDYQKFDEIGEDDTQITSADDSDLDAIKTSLANGDILTYSTRIYSWNAIKLKTNADAPENSKYENEEVVYAQIGSDGSHRMTLVGYNDNIWTDINSNNKVDEGEMGAFKIANSWGDGYANNGFAWIAYDALNAVTAVEGGPTEKKYRIFEDITRINVRPYNECADTYLKFTINTSDRTQVEVTFYSEINGTETKYQFFYGSGSAKTSYSGTTEAKDATFVFALDNICPEITTENLEGYIFDVKFEDNKEDGNSLIVKNAEVINDGKGMSYPAKITSPITLDGSDTTVNVTQTNLKNKIIYYLGYDNPILHYRKYDELLKSVKMEENYERIGYVHKYIIEDADKDVLLYFSDKNGNIDNNNGLYYTATDRLNYYTTKGVRDTVKIKDVTFDYDPLDVQQRTYFNVDASGGYEPYDYQYIVENLETGETKVYDFNYQFGEASHVFWTAGNYKLTANVLDYSNQIATFTKEVNITDVPLEFCELKADNKKLFVGNNIKFEANTQYENIISRGNVHSMYEFIIKDENGGVCYTLTKRSDKYNMTYRKSTIYLDWTPQKAGTYTISVSTTDGNNEYAERVETFVVNNKIHGDSDGNSTVNINDSTHTQKYLVNLVDSADFYSEMADCDLNSNINIKDATLVQLSLAGLRTENKVGEIIECTSPTEPETEPTTQPVTEPTTVQPTTAPVKNKVTFTNSFNWSGTIYCYYWSTSNTSMTSWPGKSMAYAGTNDYNQAMYTFEVPKDANYIIFTNGSNQTTDIQYSGGEVRYYPVAETDSKNHNLVKTW